jgi:hypothetical protein
VPDSLAAACTTPLGRAFDAKAPGVPFLDGSKSACEWRVEASSVQAGALPVSDMPSMARGDYVGNFNGSYWLTNANAPTTGYPHVAGITGTEQSLRTRSGHMLAAELQVQKGGVTRLALERKVLDSRSMSEQLFRKPILDAVCADGSASVVSVVSITQGAPGGKPQTVDLGPACKVLREWDGTANTKQSWRISTACRLIQPRRLRRRVVSTPPIPRLNPLLSRRSAARCLPCSVTVLRLTPRAANCCMPTGMASACRFLAVATRRVISR